VGLEQIWLLEKLWKRFKMSPIRTSLEIIFILGLFVGACFFGIGYLSEKGKQLAIPSKKEQIKPQDLNKIYQDNKAVGNITGKVKALKGGHLLFEELSETKTMDKEKFIEYQGSKYRIVSIKSRSTLFIDQTGTKNFVLKDVVCKIWK